MIADDWSQALISINGGPLYAAFEGPHGACEGFVNTDTSPAGQTRRYHIVSLEAVQRLMDEGRSQEEAWAHLAGV